MRAHSRGEGALHLCTEGANSRFFSPTFPSMRRKEKLYLPHATFRQHLSITYIPYLYTHKYSPRYISKTACSRTSGRPMTSREILA